MTSIKPDTNSESQIRALMNERIRAAESKDVEKLLGGYGVDVVSFDVVDPLQYAGIDEIRARMEQWFASFDGPIEIENRELMVTADANVAFCHSLSHVSGKRTAGGDLKMWWRETVCYRRIDGRWQITHQHSSVPFDAKTGKASLGLIP